MTLEDEEFLAAFRREAYALTAAAAGNLDAPIPALDDWTVRDVVEHMADGNRWVILIIRDGLRGREALEAAAAAERPAKDDDVALLRWMTDSTEELEDLLAGLAPDQRGWTLQGRDEALTFWRRRRAQENAIHRWDVESAKGAPAPIDLELALDGIDELFEVFLPRFGERVTGDGQTLHLHATDEGLDEGRGEWTVTFTPEGPSWERGHAKGDAAVRGSASDLVLLLWNRIPPSRLEVFGDATVLDRWSAQVRI